MKSNKTQKGNPHQLTLRQHCFPKRSIDRFTNEYGKVYVHLIKPAKTVILNSDNRIFCAHRIWDERAESGFMKEIEDAYQDLADRVADDRLIRRFSAKERQIVTNMYLLWNIGWFWKNQPLVDQKLKGVTDVTPKYSIDQQEILEKAHTAIIRPDTSIAGRHIAGGKIQMNLINVRKSMKYVHWGILKSRDGHFVVPDNSANRFILPVTPEICLTNGEGYRIATKYGLSEMNEQSKQESKEYYFARNLPSI